MNRPLLIYDGDCGYCRRWIERWRARTGERVRYLPYARTGLFTRLRISPRAARQSVQLIEPSGRISTGANAVFRALGRGPGLRWLAWIPRLPIVRNVAEWVYRRVANHRVALSRLDRWLGGSHRTPSSHIAIRRAWMIGVGAAYLAAFTSLRAQVLGLYGTRGIAPIRERLERFAQPGLRKFRAVPTLFWRDASDDALIEACRHGQRLAIALMLEIEPRWTALSLCAHYLSFVAAGEPFLSYQWDALLLEAGLHGAIIAPPARRASLHREEPGAWSLALLRLLAFRLHFESGLVKHRSPDASWQERTALSSYYETAPLPTPLGWYAHHLPARFQRWATALTVYIELGAATLTWLPRRLRYAGFAAVTGLQSLIALTGNYGFFNMLSIVLGVAMLDDEALPASLRRAMRTRAFVHRRGLRSALDTGAAATLFALAASSLYTAVRPESTPRWLLRLHAALGPTRSVNHYGPFSVMTRTRPEIAVEGSNDGVAWKAYGFRYKMDDPMRAPKWVAPHQPRLDWQMWFAALDGVPRWFIAFVVRLLEGSPEVLALLERNPFPARPPRYIRARLYEYRATSLAERRATGRWWRTRFVGEYMPPVGLRSTSDEVIQSS